MLHLKVKYKRAFCRLVPTSVTGTGDPMDEGFWHIAPSDITQGKELGRGSFGIVRWVLSRGCAGARGGLTRRLAEWRHTPVAIKLLYQDAQAEDRELFEREVRIMATLHQCVVGRHDKSIDSPVAAPTSCSFSDTRDHPS